MTVILELEPDVEMTATEQAKKEGLPLAEYAGKLFKDAIYQRQMLRKPTDTSFGESEDEIMAFFEDMRDVVYQEKLGTK